MTIFRAAQVDTPGAGLALVDRTLADPGPDAAPVAVEARGICHSDSLLVDDQWPVTRGHEMAGRIDALGEGVPGWRKHVRLDDRRVADANALTAGSGRLV